MLDYNAQVSNLGPSLFPPVSQWELIARSFNYLENTKKSNIVLAQRELARGQSIYLVMKSIFSSLFLPICGIEIFPVILHLY